MTKAIPVTGLWLRRISGHAEILFERDGKWYMAAREYLDSSFSHIVETGDMENAKVDEVGKS